MTPSPEEPAVEATAEEVEDLEASDAEADEVAGGTYTIHRVPGKYKA